MTTEPVDDRYPESWKPDYIKERDARVDMTAMEMHAAAMSDEEWAAFTRRARGDRN